MFSNEQKVEKLFLHWLKISLVFVFLIIIVGGLTRLTNSGLSITEWELFKGIIPPLNENSWEIYFSQYKQIPQYKFLNSNMTLDEFKVIFYWEYIHRILARLIGLFFIIPLIFFYFTKKIKKTHLNICFIILVLIILQGIIGWYMVKSGLVNDTTVSHYRLSIHLFTAILIISTIFWLTRNIVFNKDKIFFSFSFKYLPYQILIFLIFIQIIIGAFVSGLDAGKIYQTWPLMGNSYLPNDLSFDDSKIFFDLDNHSLVQLYHRSFAYIIFLYVIFLTFKIYKSKSLILYKPLSLLLIFLFLQIILGIYTLLSGLNMYIASAHQITSVLLIFSALNLYYFRVK